jgi:cytoskeletal protein CcmA (bactofilin family)
MTTTTPRFNATVPEFGDRPDMRVVSGAFGTFDGAAAHLSLGNTFSGQQVFSGPVNINAPLSVIDNVDVSGTLTVGGTVSLGQGLTVTGLTTLNGSGSVSGTLSVGQTLTVTGLATLNGGLGVVGNATVGGTLAVGDDVSLSDQLTVTGISRLNGGVEVTGYSTLNGALSVTGNAGISGTLTVIGAAGFSSGVSIGGTLTAQAIIAQGVIEARAGIGVLNGPILNQDGYYDPTGGLTAGNTTVAGTLTVSGVTTLANQLQVNGNFTTLGNVNSRQGSLFLGPAPAPNLYHLRYLVPGFARSDGLCIGTDNAQGMQFFVNGAAGGTTGWNQVSLRKLKSNIQILADPLQLVLDERLHAIRYQPLEPLANSSHASQDRFGFEAEAWLEVAPQVVHIDPETGEPTSMAYADVGCLTFEALKLLAQQVQDLEGRVASLEAA